MSIAHNENQPHIDLSGAVPTGTLQAGGESGNDDDGKKAEMARDAALAALAETMKGNTPAHNADGTAVSTDSAGQDPKNEGKGGKETEGQKTNLVDTLIDMMGSMGLLNKEQTQAMHAALHPQQEQGHGQAQAQSGGQDAQDFAAARNNELQSDAAFLKASSGRRQELYNATRHMAEDLKGHDPAAANYYEAVANRMEAVAQEYGHQDLKKGYDGHPERTRQPAQQVTRGGDFNPSAEGKGNFGGDLGGGGDFGTPEAKENPGKHVVEATLVPIQHDEPLAAPAQQGISGIASGVAGAAMGAASGALGVMSETAGAARGAASGAPGAASEAAGVAMGTVGGMVEALTGALFSEGGHSTQTMAGGAGDDTSRNVAAQESGQTTPPSDHMAMARLSGQDAGHNGQATGGPKSTPNALPEQGQSAAV